MRTASGPGQTGPGRTAALVGTCTESGWTELFSATAGGIRAMEAIISAAETGFSGSLVGSSIP